MLLLISNVIIELLTVSRYQQLTAANLRPSISLPPYFLPLGRSVPLPSLAAATLSARPVTAQRTLSAANRSHGGTAVGCRRNCALRLDASDVRRSCTRSLGVVDNRPFQLEVMFARPRRASSRRSIAERSLRCKEKMQGRISVRSLQAGLPALATSNRPIESGARTRLRDAAGSSFAARTQVRVERPTQPRSHVSVARSSPHQLFGSQAPYLIRLQEPIHGSYTRRI